MTAAATDGFVERAVLERTALEVASDALAQVLVELDGPIAAVTSWRTVAVAREQTMRARAALACITTREAP